MTTAAARGDYYREKALDLAERATDPGGMAHAQVLATLAVAAQLERIGDRLAKGLAVEVERA